MASRAAHEGLQQRWLRQREIAQATLDYDGSVSRQGQAGLLPGKLAERQTRKEIDSKLQRGMTLVRDKGRWVSNQAKDRQKE